MSLVLGLDVDGFWTEPNTFRGTHFALEGDVFVFGFERRVNDFLVSLDEGVQHEHLTATMLALSPR